MSGLISAEDSEGKTWWIPKIPSMWRHRKRGSVYVVTDYVTMQHSSDIDMRTFIVYFDLETHQKWARDIEEFIDGRFEYVPPERPTSNQRLFPQYVTHWLEKHGYTALTNEKAFPVCAECTEEMSLQDHYMVNDKLWDSVAKSNEHLHAWCLVERLGRPLMTRDFTGARINFTPSYLASYVDR